MARAIGAKTDDKGREIQLIDDGREIDLDGVLERLQIEHASDDVFNAQRATLRRLLAGNADISDAAIKAAIKAP